MNRSYYPLVLLPLIGFGIYFYFSPKCSLGDCEEGYGIKSLPGRYRYEGGFKNGLADGKGKLQWENGEYYEGEWRKGNKDGNGVNRFPDGSVYEGDWKDNKQNGRGVLKAFDGSVLYEGLWKDGKEIPL